MVLGKRWLFSIGNGAPEYGGQILSILIMYVFSILLTDGFQPPKAIKLFSCSTQQDMKIQLLIKAEIVKNKDVFLLKALRCIYPANKCKNANDYWYFNIYEQNKFHAQLS